MKTRIDQPIAPHKSTRLIKRSINWSYFPTRFILVELCLVLFASSHKIQAVSPALDGCYPGGNTAEGQSALFSRTTGGFNTAVGLFSLAALTAGNNNTALGAGTLFANTADGNTATGAGALLANSTGQDNTANGAFTLISNTTGGGNTASGIAALENNTTGQLNTAIGNGALIQNTAGGQNTALGSAAGTNVTTASKVICIGANNFGANVNDSCFIGNIRGVTTQNPDAIPVLIDSFGQLGTASSSRRFKTRIKPIDHTSESILALTPVSFRYTVHKHSAPQFGLIAEDVAEVNPDLVIYDSGGKPYTVRYDAVNVMLLNEFLKEHKKVEEQQRTITRIESAVARQQKQIVTLTSGLQRMSTQPQLRQFAPQVVSHKRINKIETED